MLKIQFILKSSKTKSNGESPIFAKVILGKKFISLSTGKSITKERWETTDKLRRVTRIEKEKVIKQSLDIFQLKIEKIYNELIRLGSVEITLEQIKNKLTGSNTDNTVYLISLFERHNNDFKMKVNSGERSTASLQKYNRSKDLIKAFLKQKYGVDDIDIAKINGSFIYNLESYLKYESTYKDKTGIKNNSVVKYFKNFKTVCNYCVKIDIIDKNPFNKYSGKINIKEATFLTQKELDSIEIKEFGCERLNKVRDIFLFSCYTGYAPIDACNLTLENLIQDNLGNYWIKTVRQKTGIKSNVPVLGPTMRIIKKYEGYSEKLLPKLSNQKMNAYLKEIADVCKIQKHLTWYVSRHTFATTVTLGNGIKLENVSSMMGHSNIKQTQHYAKVLDMNVLDDMNKLSSVYK
ncbi:MAG: site-specific integrase [Flavobacterium sp.]